MATPLQDIYDAFLARISTDEWFQSEDKQDVEEDWYQLLQMAIPRFRFPRVSLEIDEDNEYFTNTLGVAEKQLLALFMKHEWVKRLIADYDQLKPLYTDKDFSQANYLRQLINYEAGLFEDCRHAAGDYDRSRNGKPYDYTKLAGK